MMSLSRLGTGSFRQMAYYNLIGRQARLSTIPQGPKPRFDEKSAALAFGIIGASIAATASPKPLRDAAICGVAGAGYGASIAALTRIFTKGAACKPPFIIWAPMAIVAMNAAANVMNSLDKENISEKKQEMKPKPSEENKYSQKTTVSRSYSKVTVNGQEITDPKLKKEIENGVLGIITNVFGLIINIFRVVGASLEEEIKRENGRKKDP